MVPGQRRNSLLKVSFNLCIRCLLIIHETVDPDGAVDDDDAGFDEESWVSNETVTPGHTTY